MKLLLVILTALAAVTLVACEDPAGPTATPAPVAPTATLEPNVISIPYISDDGELLDLTAYEAYWAEAMRDGMVVAMQNGLSVVIADYLDTKWFIETVLPTLAQAQQDLQESIDTNDAAGVRITEALDELRPFKEQVIANLTADPEIIVREWTQGELDLYFCNRLIADLAEAVPVTGNYIGATTAGRVELALCPAS